MKNKPKVLTLPEADLVVWSNAPPIKKRNRVTVGTPAASCITFVAPFEAVKHLMSNKPLHAPRKLPRNKHPNGDAPK